MMRFTLAVLFSGLLAAQAAAQGPWYAPGSYNGFTNPDPLYQLVDSGDGIYFTGTVSGLFPDTAYQFKVATAGYTEEAPPGFNQNVGVLADSAGEININFWDDESWDDGWQPANARRVGYVDPNNSDWEVMGSFNGFATGLALTDQGNGLHTGTFAFDAGIYDWKFRRAGNWDVNIGNNGFSTNAGNNTFAVANDGDMWTFEVDLPNGRWRTIAPAAPAQPGDHNGDGSVDAADYVDWRKNPGANGGDPAGRITWEQNFGEGSAPASWLVFGPNITTTPLADQGGGEYTVTLSGLTAGTDYELKAAKSDLSVQVPGSNVKIRANDAGEIDVNFYELTETGWEDGWQPNNEHRIGYEDHDEFDWEIMGSFNGWTTPVLQLTDQGNGLHTGTFTIDTAATYDFKFRQQGDWSTSIGSNFGNGASNASLTSTAASELWQFELDLPNGKWRAFAVPVDGSSAGVPEPSALLLLVLGSLLALGCQRRK